MQIELKTHSLAYEEQDTKLVAVFTEYMNKRTAIQLFDRDTGEPVATATINVPNDDLMPGEVCIKNYSENVGVQATLIDNGIIRGKVERHIITGYEMSPVHRLTTRVLDGLEGKYAE